MSSLSGTAKWALYWIAYQLLSIPLFLIGIPLIAILASMRAWYTRPSKNPMFPGTVTAWIGEPLTLLWGNDETGVDNGTGSSLEAFKWSALRNPVNNLRLIRGASCYSVDPKFTEYNWGYIATDTDGRWCINIKGRKFGWLINRDAKSGWRSWPVCF